MTTDSEQTAYLGEHLPAVYGLQQALAQLKDADAAVREADEAKRQAERARAARRKAVGAALSVLRHALDVPAARAVRAATTLASVDRYVEIEDGTEWDTFVVERVTQFLRGEAQRIAQGAA